MKSILKIAVLSLIAIPAALRSTAATKPQAEKLNKQQLQSLIAAAKTPAEHERIARYYESQAQNDLAQANEHTKMALEFRKNSLTSSSKWSSGTVNHCEYLAQSLAKDAARMQQLAHEHEQMALRAGGR